MITALDSTAVMIFFIPELLQLICDNCDQSTLVALALTSRCFYEPAQDILWQHLGNLGPLIRCMPDNLWNERREGDWIELSFCRSIKETDWDRFQANAMRVRTFGSPIMQQDRFRITKGIYHSFHEAGATRLLPNVRVLSWPCDGQVDTDDVFPHISLFLSPSIRELDIAVIPPEAQRCEARVSLLPSLVSLCPYVVSFHLNVTNDTLNNFNSDGYLDYYLVTYSVISQWQSLKHLRITELPGEALPDLPRFLPALHTLEISFRAYDFPESPVHLHPERRFTAMDKLIVWNCCYSIALQLVQMMSQTSLRSISLNFEDEDDHFSSEDRQSLFHTMQDHLGYHCLEEISLDCYWYGPYGESDEPHPVRALAPLFPFKNLKKLSIAYCDTFNLDDAAIEFAAVTWIHLEHLNFGVYEFSLVGTIRGLISIAKHCRALRHLEFAFDAAVITEDIMNSICDVRNESLHILDVKHSPIKNHSRVAEVLAKIFPMLQDIDVSPFGSLAWKEVEKLLPMLTTGRITD